MEKTWSESKEIPPENYNAIWANEAQRQLSLEEVLYRNGERRKIIPP